MVEWDRSAPIAGRSYANAYRSRGKDDLAVWLRDAAEASGGTVLSESGAGVSPMHLGIRLPGDERLGAMVYAFRSKSLGTGGRPEDEYEIQVRLMSESAWEDWEHPVGFDPAGVDATAVIGIQLDAGIGVALDPRLYDPLPMGNSVQVRHHDIAVAQEGGWHVWERGNAPGTRREARSAQGFETCIAFRSERLVDLLRFERDARELELDQALRHQAAVRAGQRPSEGLRHSLEDEWGLNAHEILDLIADRRRLGTAVKGGVAELHLERHLREHLPEARVIPLDKDAQPDFEVVVDGESLRVECKNVLSTRTDPATGAPLVELWKTRGSVPGRLYDTDAFDVVAACLYPQTHAWEFRFKRTADMPRYPDYPDKLHNFHTVDETWQPTLPGT
ncbi:hypothetical protein [Egibacter rhizosphaerae]|uniref:hypothetical protein n=1 Tax=Egibacter rhizosphaerae TaxID=1670831 RepID=UPI00197AAE92|nr:hypothetical protein [Egibacter rhizosphaerae]